jgi:HSP20 family protein
MAQKNTFSKHIRELSGANELEYTEDFFKQTFGSPEDTDVSVTTIKAQTAPRSQQSISHQFSDSDIDGAWLEQEENFDGQLAVDVLQTDKDIIITSTVAGVSKKDLDINMHGDMITIKGIRRHHFSEVAADDYFIRECYWGGFSRSIILPLDIVQDGISATLEQGVLTIRLPKSQRSHNAKIEVKEL